MGKYTDNNGIIMGKEWGNNGTVIFFLDNNPIHGYMDNKWVKL
jgi:hypothetical protein